MGVTEEGSIGDSVAPMCNCATPGLCANAELATHQCDNRWLGGVPDTLRLVLKALVPIPKGATFLLNYNEHFEEVQPDALAEVCFSCGHFLLASTQDLHAEGIAADSSSVVSCVRDGCSNQLHDACMEISGYFATADSVCARDCMHVDCGLASPLEAQQCCSKECALQLRPELGRVRPALTQVPPPPPPPPPHPPTPPPPPPP